MSSKRIVLALPLIGIVATIGVVLLSTAHAAPVVAEASTAQGGERGICYHTDPSDYHCPDSTANFFANASNIAKITMTIVDKSGKTQSMDLPGGTDAVFLSSYAVRNFLVRYYRDTKQSAKMRRLTTYLERHIPTP